MKNKQILVSWPDLAIWWVCLSMTGWPKAARCEAWDGATTVSCEQPSPQNLSITSLVGGIPLLLLLPFLFSPPPPQTPTPVPLPQTLFSPSSAPCCRHTSTPPLSVGQSVRSVPSRRPSVQRRRFETVLGFFLVPLVLMLFSYRLHISVRVSRLLTNGYHKLSSRYSYQPRAQSFHH